MIYRELPIQYISAQNSCMQQVHANRGHRVLHQSYANLTDEYYWNHSFSDVRKFVESCEIRQATKSSIQKPVGLLRQFTVHRSLWIAIALYVFFLKQFVVDCTKLISVMGFPNEQKPHLVTCCQLLNIKHRHFGCTCSIRYTAVINAADVVDTFARHIKATIILRCVFVSD